MKVGLRFWSGSIAPMMAVALVLLLVFSAPGRCQSTDEGCAVIKERWEKTFQELRDKIQDFSAIQQIPVARLIQKPLYDAATAKTIASQVGEALQAKEEILSARRRECRDMMSLEEELFSRLQDCAGNGKNSKEKEFKNFLKKRQALLDKAIVTIAEVREVEGKETVLPYSEAMGNQDPYSRSVNNYWQTYQQMYRRWGGY